MSTSIILSIEFVFPLFCFFFFGVLRCISTINSVMDWHMPVSLKFFRNFFNLSTTNLLFRVLRNSLFGVEMPDLKWKPSSKVTGDI